MTQVKLDGPVSGEPFVMMPSTNLGAAGYVREEWFVSGAAHSYGMEDERSEDGCWEAKHADEEPFTTRVVVCRPEDASRFNGTVFVEWMNVSGGVDAAPDFMFLHRHLTRTGAAWVGVSAQKAGVDGGGLVPGMPLKQANAQRYGGLVHPGDAYAFGIYTATARALRSPGSGPLAALEAERLIAVGESQSAGYLVSYVNAVDAVERCFDGFLIHGRAGMAAPLDGTYIRATEDGDLSNVSAVLQERHRIREDARVPVIVVQSETDVTILGGGRARQPDSGSFRLWEIAGAAHFDTYGVVASMIDREGIPVEELAQQMAPSTEFAGMSSQEPVNCGPQQHYVLNAAATHLDHWVRDGTPPPEAARLHGPDEDASTLERDALGIACGGIRTPWVEAPSAVLSCENPGGDGFLFLFGRTRLLDEAALSRLYPGGREEHLRRFEAATEEALAAGFLLDVDADEVRALARHGRQPSGWRKE